MNTPNWDDLHSPEEWADVLDDLAEDAARRGAYTEQSNLKYSAQCIRHLAVLADAGAELAADAEKLRREVMAAKESLTSKPL